MTTEKRFWSKVDKNGPNGCWIWTAAKFTQRGGYGMFRRDKQAEYAHRVAWAMANGPIPDGMCLCHVCDNPPCVNPAHLFIGTRADNLRDMRQKGRDYKFQPTRGEDHPSSKLTEAEVRKIRALLAMGTEQQIIAEEFGVKKVTISHINTRRLWRHVN